MTELRELLTAVARQPATEWQARLATALPGQPGLIRQALLWLHAGREQLEDEPRPPRLGAIGDARYRLTTKLDVGASASVWQAHDRKLERNVAIKLFHHDGESRDVVRAIAEARAACDVLSDHVVRVHDVHGDAPPYIVMELISEHDPETGQLVLGADASACRPRSVDEAVRWLVHLARGVHDAHLRNVFHRDLKPKNVLITPISRRARVADFGLAVSTQAGAGSSMISGTPEYMAPEQARGLPSSLDLREPDDRAVLVAVDVWGLGALGYEFLTGRPPWHAEDDELDAWELAASTPPPKLVRMSNGDRVPRPLRRILDKTMAPHARDRYATAAEVADELEAFLARRPTSLDRSRGARTTLWCRRNPQLVATGLVALALGILTIATGATVARLRTERDQLDRQVVETRREQERLTDNMAHARSTLRETQRELGTTADELVRVESALHDTQQQYELLLRAKESALSKATTTSRQLVAQLEATRIAQRAAATRVGGLEAALTTSRRETQRAARERDRARAALEVARAEREAARTDLAALQARLRALSRALADAGAAPARSITRDRPPPAASPPVTADADAPAPAEPTRDDDPVPPTADGRPRGVAQ